jgi:hypothetical protein
MDRWEYLISKEYMIRHHICEYYFGDVDTVIDVGAYKQSLINVKRVVQIDPLGSMPESFHGTVKEWCNKQGEFFDISECGVMALGLEIEGDDGEWNCFSSLVEQSKVAIIEHSVTHAPSVLQFNKILDTTEKRVTTMIDFEFCDMQTEGFIPHGKRKLAILERK